VCLSISAFIHVISVHLSYLIFIDGDVARFYRGHFDLRYRHRGCCLTLLHPEAKIPRASVRTAVGEVDLPRRKDRRRLVRKSPSNGKISDLMILKSLSLMLLLWILS